MSQGAALKVAGPKARGKGTHADTYRQCNSWGDLLFLTNVLLADDLPINIITVVICAILGVVGWAIILILHLLGLAF